MTNTINFNALSNDHLHTMLDFARTERLMVRDEMIPARYGTVEATMTQIENIIVAIESELKTRSN